MKRFMLSLSVVASLYGLSISGTVSTTVDTTTNVVSNTVSNIVNNVGSTFLKSTNDFFGDSKYSNVSINEAKLSNKDMQKEVEFFADPSRCFNAFSIPDPSNLSFSPFSILTQIQNSNFYLKIIRKHTPVCSEISDVNVTLIDENGNKIDYTKSSLNPITEPSDYGYFVMPIQFNVHNAYRDVFVHFSYKIKNREVGCSSSAYVNASTDDKFTVNVGASAKCYLKTTAYTKEENATDDFAVRPKQFNISADSSVFVGKPLNIDITAIGANGNNDISTNYNADDVDLNTEVIDSNTGLVDNTTNLSYFYNIKNGKIDRYRFFFTKPTKNDVKIKISEKLGKEWAIVDADDTKDSRRLITPGESNSIKVLETSKNWAGAGTGEKANNPKNKTIQSTIRSNTNQNLRFNKMNW